MIHSHMERTDYDEYVNGEWKKNNIILSDQTRWGSFNILVDDNMLKLKEICESDKGLVGQLYEKFMIPPTEVSPHATALLEIINTIVSDSQSYQMIAGKLFTYGIGTLFHICKSADDKDPDTKVPHITQSGLGLPV